MAAMLQPGDCRKFWCPECGTTYYLTLVASPSLERVEALAADVKRVVRCPFCGTPGPVANYNVTIG
jgi:hypothetical protein